MEIESKFAYEVDVVSDMVLLACDILKGKENDARFLSLSKLWTSLKSVSIARDLSPIYLLQFSYFAFYYSVKFNSLRQKGFNYFLKLYRGEKRAILYFSFFYNKLVFNPLSGLTNIV